MLEEDPTDTVSLDSESRVRGICQLMDGLIYDIKVDGFTDSEEDQERLVSLFDSAVESLDSFLALGYSFIARYRERQIINAKEEVRSRRIIEDKYDAVMKILKREYSVLGMPEVEE
jgi:hypothetical protein